MMEEVTITSKGQITIPKKIRKKFHLKEGEKLMVYSNTEEFTLRPKIKDPINALEKMRKEVSFTEEEIDKMIRESKKEWSKIE